MPNALGEAEYLVAPFVKHIYCTIKFSSLKTLDSTFIKSHLDRIHQKGCKSSRASKVAQPPPLPTDKCKYSWPVVHNISGECYLQVIAAEHADA